MSNTSPTVKEHSCSSRLFLFAYLSLSGKEIAFRFPCCVHDFASFAYVQRQPFVNALMMASIGLYRLRDNDQLKPIEIRLFGTTESE